MRVAAEVRDSSARSIEVEVYREDALPIIALFVHANGITWRHFQGESLVAGMGRKLTLPEVAMMFDLAPDAITKLGVRSIHPTRCKAPVSFEINRDNRTGPVLQNQASVSTLRLLSMFYSDGAEPTEFGSSASLRSRDRNMAESLPLGD